MADLNKMLDSLKERTEEAFECYSNKEHWDGQDLKCAKEAAELYDKLQTIQMNTGIWEGIKEDGGYSGARYPRISYGYGDSHARGRDSDAGRYVSRGHDDMYYDEYDHSMRGNRDSYARDGRRMTSRRGYDDGRSMHSVKDQAIQRLEALMDTAESEHERQEIMKMIKTIEAQER